MGYTKLKVKNETIAKLDFYTKSKNCANKIVNKHLFF